LDYTSQSGTQVCAVKRHIRPAATTDPQAVERLHGGRVSISHQSKGQIVLQINGDSVSPMHLSPLAFSALPK
jgi:hypothetical protein